MTKVIPGCRHKIDVLCFQVPSKADCIKDCQMTLACGHRCKLTCKEDCKSKPCEEIVTISQTNSCGHRITMKCYDYHTGKWLKVLSKSNCFSQHISSLEGLTMTDERKGDLLMHCAQNCGNVLHCEHICKGSCGRCFNGRIHVSCEENCGRTLVCGHR